MPLDVDQYNVRRYYRNGYMVVTEEKSVRDPQTGALTGKTSKEVFRFKYKQASLTTADTKMMSTNVIQRITKKVEVPYLVTFDHADHAKLMVTIDNMKYNIERVEPTYNNTMFVYLSSVSNKREVNNA